jgi:cyanamide hydratase
MSKTNGDSKQSAIRQHNFEAVPRNLSKIISGINLDKRPQPFQELFPLPHSKAASEVYEYAKAELTTPVLNHSLRVYQYGMFIASDFFPDWNLNSETWLLACLLHDIGASPANRSTSLLSFEFKGGLIAHEKTQSWGCPTEQSDGVTEAIIRHQDIDSTSNGNITRLGALLQLATLYDNSGQFDQLIHQSTLDGVTQEHPRLKWSSCFSDVIEYECDTKPWCHTTKIGKEQFLSLINGDLAVTQKSSSCNNLSSANIVDNVTSDQSECPADGELSDKSN